MGKYRVIVSVAALTLAAGICRAAEPATRPALTEALSPAVQQAIAELSSDDFKTRQAALDKLQMAMGRQMRALISSDDPEVQARLTSLLQFNDGLTRWMLDVMKLPPDQQKAQLDFGLREDVLPTIAGVFSAESDKRVEGVKALGKLNDPESTAMLARLMDDPDRQVYLAAMEAVWDRKPTQAVVDALWQRAIETGFAGFRPQAVPAAGPNVMFRGRAVNGVMFINRGYPLAQDASIACDVLVHFHSPMVGQKLDAFMGTLEGMLKVNPWLLNSNTEYMKNMFRLVAEYKTKDSLKVLYRIATSPEHQPFIGQVGNERYYWSARTAPLAAVIEATDQKPEDYQLKRVTPMGGVWTFPAEQDENNAIKKLQEWMAANAEKAGLKEVVEAATQPATQQAAPPAAVVPGQPGQIMIRGNVMIQGVGGGAIHVEGAGAPAADDKPAK